MTEQWQELKETIIEMRDNDGTGTQQEVCKFLVNYMNVLEKQMQDPIFDKIRAEIDAIEAHGQIDEHTLFARSGEEVKKIALEIIDKYIANNKDMQWKMENCCCIGGDRE